MIQNIEQKLTILCLISVPHQSQLCFTLLLVFFSSINLIHCNNSTGKLSPSALLQLKIFLSVENSTSNAAVSSSSIESTTNVTNYSTSQAQNSANGTISYQSTNETNTSSYQSTNGSSLYQSINGTVYIPPPPIIPINTTTVHNELTSLKNIKSLPSSISQNQSDIITNPSVLPIYVTVTSGLPPNGVVKSSSQVLVGTNGTTTVYESKSLSTRFHMNPTDSSRYAKTIKRPKPGTPAAASFSSGSNATVAYDSVSYTMNQTYIPYPSMNGTVHRLPPPNIASSSSASSSSDSNSSLSYYIPPLNPSMVSSVSMLTNGISEFATSLYLVACKNSQNNVALATLASQLSLALLYCGAQGETAVQMEEALSFHTATQQQIADSFHALLTPLQTKTSRLDTANGIFINRKHYIQPLYKNMANYQFYTKVQSLSFKNSIHAANIINSYVQNKTDNYIANLIQPKWIYENESIVMVNAVRFKGLWQHAFDEIITKHVPFYSYLNGGKQSGTVDMMHVHGQFNYGKISNLQSYAIELPYQHINMSMIFLLPYDCMKFSELQSGLGNKSFLFSSLNNQMKLQQVDVHLPKFEIEYEVPNMKHYYKQLGLGIIFERANFNGIVQESVSSSFQLSVRVNRITHKTYFEVDRFGTKAEATNEFLMNPFAMNPASATPQFMADHSFVFAVQYKGEIVFIGRFIKP